MNNAEQKLELKLVLRIKIHAFRCDLSGKFPLRDSVEIPWSVLEDLKPYESLQIKVSQRPNSDRGC